MRIKRLAMESIWNGDLYTARKSFGRALNGYLAMQARYRSPRKYMTLKGLLAAVTNCRAAGLALPAQCEAARLGE